jgi:hypothetical protein
MLTHSEIGQALGLDPFKTEALLKRHTVTEQATFTDEKIKSDRGGDVRLERADVLSRTFSFGPESEEELLEESLVAWQRRGPAAAWQAMFDILGLWFEAQGLDPEAQVVDRAHIEVHRVPWQGTSAEDGHDG